MVSVLLWPLITGQRTLKWDASDLTLPAFSLIRSALWRGEWPVWNPFQDQGWATGIVPLFWNPVYLILGGIFAHPHKALNAAYLLLLFISGWGFYKFSGLFLSSRVLRVAAGIVYPLSGFFLGHSQHLGWIEGAAWIPIILYLTHRYYDEQKTHHLLYLGISFFLFSTAAYPGYVIILVYFLIFQALYYYKVRTGFRSLSDIRHYKSPLRTGLVTGLLSWLTWKLYYEQWQYITRGTGDWKISTDSGASLLPDLWSLIFPTASLSGSDGIWTNDVALIHSFFGIILLIFSLYALLRKPGRTELYLGLTALFGILLSLANDLPFRSWLNILPGFSLFRMAALFRIFAIGALIISGLRGIEKYARLRDKKWMSVVLGTVFILLWVFWRLYFSRIPGILSEENPAHSLFYSDLLKASLFLAFTVLLLWVRPRFLLAGLSVLVVSEVAIPHFQNQDRLLYSRFVSKEFSNHISYPEKKIFVPDPNQPIGQYRDHDFQIAFLYRNTGTLTHHLVQDGYWPYESHFHHRLENSGHYDSQLRYPLWYFSRDTGDFYRPDYLNFENTIECKKWKLSGQSLRLVVEKPTTLVFNQNYHKNWKAKLDGQILPVSRANEGMMKMKIPAGEHFLTLRHTSDGTSHLFLVTLGTLLLFSILLIRRNKFDFSLLAFLVPLLILMVSGSSADEETPLSMENPENRESDFLMNYESNQDYWYFRPNQITIADSYDGYRAESFDESYIYSATLNIPGEKINKADSLYFQFRIKSMQEAEPAVTMRTYTENDDIYKIKYLKTFQKGSWDILKGDFEIPDSEEDIRRVEFYIWNHKKNTYLLDDIRVRLNR